MHHRKEGLAYYQTLQAGVNKIAQNKKAVEILKEAERVTKGRLLNRFYGIYEKDETHG